MRSFYWPISTILWIRNFQSSVSTIPDFSSLKYFQIHFMFALITHFTYLKKMAFPFAIYIWTVDLSTFRNIKTINNRHKKQNPKQKKKNLISCNKWMDDSFNIKGKITIIIPHTHTRNFFKFSIFYQKSILILFINNFNIHILVLYTYLVMIIFLIQFSSFLFA